MDRATRTAIENGTEEARKVLEEDLWLQLEGTFDIMRGGALAATGGAHLSITQVCQRDKIVGAIEYKRSGGMTAMESVTDYVRDAAFTTLNRFVALKMLEARQLVQECITKGERSAGYREFCGMAPGVELLPEDTGYRVYIECLFDELSTEMKVLFDRRDASSVLWPRRQTFGSLLGILNANELSDVWGDDETIGWVYQFFNSKAERAKMRDPKQGGSQAPRNNRELAVRNQFFTPRYVVQFLTDNTLGRLWLEMYGGDTCLAERCEYLVRSNEPTRSRLMKDPRDLRILDPACGSGHFLLYSFDLLLAIYDEAWARDSDVQSEATGRTLREDYADLADLRREVPALIVEHNLHGVDIDPRCAQIAALALWLRAQRAWTEAGVPASARPRIIRTHIVVGEPVPGGSALVEEFAAGLDPPLLRGLFKRMVGESRLAGELGTLLRVEDGIAIELRRAREQFIKEQSSTSLPGFEPEQNQNELDLSGITDDSFFHEAEAEILDALRRFAETATGDAIARRRLFVGDAAQGIALIELVRTHFDVVLMNPPFGAVSLAAKQEFERSYPHTKNDLYAAFVERGIHLLHPAGLLGAITSRTGFFLSSFQKWREQLLLKEAPPIVFADLGYGVMDAAMVEATAFCLQREPEARAPVKTVFLRALEAEDKAAFLRLAVRDPASGAHRMEMETETFSAIPGSPFAYWISPALRGLFQTNESLTGRGIVTKCGLGTLDDFRFLRTWWEPAHQDEWRHLIKGERSAPWYGSQSLVVSWHRNGRELKSFVESKVGSASRKVQAQDFYGRPGLTWSRRPHRRGWFRTAPASAIFADNGPMAFADTQTLTELLPILNSAVAQALMQTQMSRGQGGSGQTLTFEVGVVDNLPLPDGPIPTVFPVLARRAWSLKRSLDTWTETSHAFVLPALLQTQGDTLHSRAAVWRGRARSIESELATIQVEIDEHCFALYGIEGDDRRAIVDGFAKGATGSEASDNEEEADAEEGGDAKADSGTQILAIDLIQWAVGIAFGRFDVRLATGRRTLPAEPDPFDPLPDCSAAMLSGEDGQSLDRAPLGYPLSFPENGILVDDPGHPRDLTAAVRAVFDCVFGASADVWWDDVSALLDAEDHDVRAWLASKFFDHHLKGHSKSRRKAPILWQLGTSSGSYSVWLYAHRLTRDSLFQIQNDIVGPKLAHEERRLAALEQSSRGALSAKERREIAAQEMFVEDLRALVEEVKRVAPLWIPTLDDGLALTMAPLWRLVPQHRPWQSELKNNWEDLAVGRYDWAHLAMHLWPERVVSKCAGDRSLAIAHGLEEALFVEGADGKWTARSTPARPTEELVGERSSPAVRDALTSLLEAPAASAGNGRGSRRRAATAAAHGVTS